MEFKTRLGGNGRIVLPAAARRALGIEPGDELLVVVENQEIRLLTVAEAARKAQGLVGRYIGENRSLADDLVTERRQDAGRE